MPQEAAHVLTQKKKVVTFDGFTSAAVVAVVFVIVVFLLFVSTTAEDFTPPPTMHLVPLRKAQASVRETVDSSERVGRSW